MPPAPRNLSLFLGIASIAPLAAQTGEWAADTAAPGLGGRVFAFAEWQGALFAGGHPFAANGGEIASLARWNGERWLAVGTGVDLVTGWASFATPTIRAMCEFQGELVIAGTFDRAGGQVRDNIARWNGSTFAPLGQGLVEIGWDADVRALAVYNNELYATGTFDQAGGLAANGLAKWNGSAWSVLGSGLTGVGGSQGEGHALLVVGNELILAGAFTAVAGVPAQNIARWNGTTWAPLGAGFDARVDALAEHGGQLVAAGSYSFSGTSPLTGPAAWNGASWQPLGSGGPTFVTSLRTVGTQLYAGGAFASPGSCLARWNGSTWQGVGGVTGVFSGTTGTLVLALAEHGGELIVGGEFTRGGNPPQGATGVVSTNVIAFDGSAWRGMGAGRGVHGAVRKVVAWRDAWYAVGNFDEAGTAASAGIARWDGDRWQSFGGCNGVVENAVVFQDALVVNGAFTQIGGQGITNSARFDGSTWTQFGPPIIASLAVHQGQLYAAGGSDLRRWNGTGWTSVANVGGIADDLHVHDDGNLYFTTTTFSQYTVQRWNGTTAAVIGTANNFLHCLGSFGGQLVAGGRFTTIGGVSANLLARWNGTTWSSFGSGVTGYAVDSLCELDDQLYIGANGDPRGFLLRWNGSAWSAVPGALDGLPLCLFADAAVGSVHAFGALHFAAGRPAWNYGEWRTRPRWRDLLHGGPSPRLRGDGTLLPGSAWTFTVHAAPSHLGVVALGLSRIDQPLFGGTLVPSPDVLQVVVGDASGNGVLAATWPASVPGGVAVFAQAFVLDTTQPAGLASSNALVCQAP